MPSNVLPPGPDAPGPDAAPAGASTVALGEAEGARAPGPDAQPRSPGAPATPEGAADPSPAAPGALGAPPLGAAAGRPPLAPPTTRAEIRQARRPHRSIARRAVVWVAIVVVLAMAAGAGALAHTRLYAAPPRATVTLTVAPKGPVIDPGAVASAAAPLPWPAIGQGAVAIPSVGYSAQSGPEQSVPVASMTKIMTGYLILRDHPLGPGQDGPPITITPADVSYYDQDTATDQANVPLAAGEVLSERQMLEGLLIHSANDFAYSLGAWDAGSVPAFVAKMNAAASQLGMAQTHYVDPSGYLPQSQSTAADLLKVATVALREPTFASIVTMANVSLPLSGLVSSYTPLLPGEVDGNPAVVGVKSGFTTAAGGGDVLAFNQEVGGHQVLVLAAVTGQQTGDVLTAAGLAALALAQAAGSRLVVATTDPIGTAVGTAQVPGASVPAVTTGSGSLVAWPGQRLGQGTTVVNRPYAGAPAGAALGYVTYSLGSQRLAALVRTTAGLPAPSVTQRLF